MLVGSTITVGSRVVPPLGDIEYVGIDDLIRKLDGWLLSSMDG